MGFNAEADFSFADQTILLRDALKRSEQFRQYAYLLRPVFAGAVEPDLSSASWTPEQ